MRRHSISVVSTARPGLSVSTVLAGAMLLAACGDDRVNAPPELEEGGSGFATTGGPGGHPGGGDDPGDPSEGSGSPIDPGTDDGEPGGPGVVAERCDAGNEAFVARLIPFVHGRKPESIREVRLLASLIEQLDARGLDGRLLVARGLARGDQYLDRFRTYLYEELKINLAGDRRNDECYNRSSGQGSSPDLAAFIRDNDADAAWDGPDFWMPDVVRSGLLLDDMSTIYRADLFARMSVPLIAGNVTAEELEDMRRTSYGSVFEQTFLGRTTECLACHTTESSVTDGGVHDRHWPVPGNFELAVYGPDAKMSLSRRHYAVFRYFNFATPYYLIYANGVPGGQATAFGMGPECGAFRIANPGVVPGLFNSPDYRPYLISDFGGAAATIADFDELFRQGFDAVRQDGLTVAEDQSVEPRQAAAYLFAMHFSNRLWIESMGFPLTVANNFPRNEAQRDLLHELADTFASDSYSLRSLIGAIATHDYFNQAPPAECDTSTPYFMPAVFEPFSWESTDPAARGNGVGDSVHRLGAWPLLDALAHSMWWRKPDTFGADLVGEIPEFNCGGDQPERPCVAEPADAQVLRDLGAFLSDSEGGFEGIDMVGLLRLEAEFGNGNDPGMSGACTGPLGQPCATDDFITTLVELAASRPGTDMWAVASAVKDRVITEPGIRSGAEQALLEDLMGVSLTDTVTDVGVATAERAARRLAGMLFNTPQFMMVGVASGKQDPVHDPELVVPGTSTEELCNVLAPLVLRNELDMTENDFIGYTCSSDGIELVD